MSERVQKRKVHIAVNLDSADRTGPQSRPYLINFQFLENLVAFSVAHLPFSPPNLTDSYTIALVRTKIKKRDFYRDSIFRT
jgi:hypothetical protein